MLQLHDFIPQLRIPPRVLPGCVVLCCAVQASEQRMRDMMDRLETTENRQNTIVSFLARLAQNPTVLQQMVSVAQNVGLQRSLNDGRNGGESQSTHSTAREAVCGRDWPR